VTEAENINNDAKPAKVEAASLRFSESGKTPLPLRAAPFLLLIKLYQFFISPLLHALSGPNAGCRFYPSCSCYAAEALRTHGVLHGTALAVWRLLRCNPFTAGGVDLVPPASARPRCQRVA